jgi:hypothetical protein
MADVVHDAPKGIEAARELAATQVKKMRLSAATALEGSDAQLDVDTVARLFEAAVVYADVRALTQTLVEASSRDSIIWIELVKLGVTDVAPVNSLSLEADAKMRQLRAAVLAAALSEQHDSFGAVLSEDGTFSAATLEATLDDWVKHGRYRPGAEGAQLTQIDQAISQKSIGPSEELATRLGLIYPLVSVIHIWRTLDELPADAAQRMGWGLIEPKEPTATVSNVEAQPNTGA